MAARKGGDMDARHVRRARARRRALGLAAVGTAAGVLGMASTGLAKPPEDNGGEKVKICHATNSYSNPYVSEEVSVNGLNGHDGHVNDPSKGKWGDVIPPTDEFPGYNWTTAGQALLANDCFALDITKTGDATVLPGGEIKYEIKVTNLSLVPFPYAKIFVSDPKATTLSPPVDPPKWLQPGDELTWLATKSVKDSLRKCGWSVKNTAVVTNEAPKTSSSRRKRSSEDAKKMDASSWTTQVVCPLNVTIAKSSTQTGIEPGGTVNYLIRVTNPGPLALPTKNLSVADPTATSLTPPAEIPEMLKAGEFLDWAATKSVAADAALCGTNVDNTASVTITPPAMPEDKVQTARKKQNGESQYWWPYTSWPEGPVTAVAAAIPVTGAICNPETPVTPAGTVTQAAAPVALRPAGPALSVTKTGPTRVLAGGRVGYRITVTNTGSADATNVTLRDQAPGVFTVSSRPSGSTVSGRTIDWNIGTLTPGQSVTKAVRFAARRTATGRACNVALATATGVDQVRDRACTTIVAARRPATPVTG